MGILIKDPETDRAVRRLAKLKGKTLTEAVRDAVQKELEVTEPNRDDAQLEELIRKFSTYPDTGVKADKAFFDSLYES